MSEEKTLVDEEALKLKVCSLKAYAIASLIANHFQDELEDFAFQLYSFLELSTSIPTKNTEESIMSFLEVLIQKAVEKNIPGFYIDDEIKKELCIILFSAFSKLGSYGENKDHPKMDIPRFVFDQDANEDTLKSKFFEYFHHVVKIVEDDRSTLSMLDKIIGAPSHLYFIVNKIFQCQNHLFIEQEEKNKKRVKQIYDQLFDLQLDFMMTHPIFGRTKEMIKIFFKLDFEYFYPQELYKRPYDIAFKVTSLLYDDKEEFYEQIVLDFPRFNDKKWGHFAKIITHHILLEKNDVDFINSAEVNDAAVLDYAINKKNGEFIARYLSIVRLDALNRILEILPKPSRKLLQKHLTKINYYQIRLNTACENNDYRTVHDYFSIHSWDLDPRYEVVPLFREISLPTLFGGNDEVDTESNYYHCFEQSLFEYLDYIQLNYVTNDERLIEKHELASQWLLELLNPDLSGKERITFLKNHLEELLRKNPETGIRTNRGTGGYFWYGFFNGIKNPFDGRYSRSTTETKAIELYESLISLQQSIPNNDEVPYDIYSLSSAGG